VALGVDLQEYLLVTLGVCQLLDGSVIEKIERG
jgi:hypothetical protein